MCVAGRRQPTSLRANIYVRVRIKEIWRKGTYELGASIGNPDLEKV